MSGGKSVGNSVVFSVGGSVGFAAAVVVSTGNSVDTKQSL